MKEFVIMHACIPGVEQLTAAFLAMEWLMWYIMLLLTLTKKRVKNYCSRLIVFIDPWFLWYIISGYDNHNLFFEERTGCVVIFGLPLHLSFIMLSQD